MAVAQSEDETPTSTGTGTEPQPSGDANAAAANRLAARRAAKAAAKAAKKGTNAAIPDEAQERVEAAARVYEKNSNKLWIGLGAFVLVSAGVFGVLELLGSQNYEAAAALEEGVDAARGVIVKEGEDGPTDDSIETFPSIEARAKKAQEAYAATASKFSGKLAARWAKLGEATALTELGKHADAQKIYESLTGDEEPFIAARAIEGVAFALEGQGKHAEAASQFEALGKVQDGAYKPLADYGRARMLVAQGKQREAATVLETLIKAERNKPETTPARFVNVVSDAETLLTELSVQLEDPKLRADIPKARSAGGGNSDIMDALRMQLGGPGEGGSQLSPELLEMLQKQLGGAHGQQQPGTAP